MTFENLDLLVPANLKSNKVPMLIGEPGIGKSSWVEALAASMGTACFTLPVNQLADKADLTGARLVPVNKMRIIRVTNADGSVGEQEQPYKDYEQMFFPHQVIAQAIDYAEAHPNETPILFLDEINQTTPDVTSEALSIPTARSIGARRLPSNLRVITAGNDKGNVQALDKASVTRFVLYRIEPDIATFLKVNPNLNSYIRDVLTKNPSMLFLDTQVTGISQSGDDDDDEEEAITYELSLEESMEQITTPRTITALSEWLNCYTHNDLMGMLNTPDGEQSVLQSALEAHTGKTAFTLALLDEILKAQPQAQSTAASIQMPQQYPLLAGAQSRDDMNAIITAMSPEERSAMLIYAVYDSRDNANLLSCLAPQVAQIMPNDISMLIQLSTNHQLNRANFDALQGIQCTSANVIQVLGL